MVNTIFEMSGEVSTILRTFGENLLKFIRNFLNIPE